MSIRRRWPQRDNMPSKARSKSARVGKTLSFPWYDDGGSEATAAATQATASRNFLDALWRRSTPKRAAATTTVPAFSRNQPAIHVPSMHSRFMSPIWVGVLFDSAGGA